MKFIFLALLGMGLLTGVAGGQSPPANDRQVHAVAEDATDGSFVAGGHYYRPAGRPERRAFIARHAANGAELWRHLVPCVGAEGCGLELGLTSIDPDHIAEASVRDAVIDRVSGSIFVLSDVTLAWVGTGCTEAAAGTLLTRLSASGLVLADVYVGDLPTGAPAPDLSCDSLCTSSEAFLGRGIVLGPSGEVTVHGLRRAPAQGPADGEIQGTFTASFTRALTPLAPVEDVDANIGEGVVECVSETLRETPTVIKSPHANSTPEWDVGFVEAEASLTTQCLEAQTPFLLRVTYDELHTSGDLTVRVRDVSSGEFSVVMTGQFSPGLNAYDVLLRPGCLDAEYIDTEGNIEVRVEGCETEPGPDGNDDSDPIVVVEIEIPPQL